MTLTSFKICLRCQEDKAHKCFGWSGYIKKDGNKSLSSYCKTCQNELRVQRKYGVSYKDYLKILEQQGGCCANSGCKATEPGAPGRTRFYIDHCHVTNKIRGLLCHSCNLALGHVADDVKKLNGLICYLNNSADQKPRPAALNAAWGLALAKAASGEAWLN
jgi:hypothetical protein